jgi:hypothetical protein
MGRERFLNVTFVPCIGAPRVGLGRESMVPVHVGRWRMAAIIGTEEEKKKRRAYDKLRNSAERCISNPGYRTVMTR